MENIATNLGTLMAWVSLSIEWIALVGIVYPPLGNSVIKIYKKIARL